MVITGSSEVEIQSLKALLNGHFHMKDLGPLRYFLGLEIGRTSQGIFMSQKKFTLDLIKEAGLDNARPSKVPMDQHLKLTADEGDPLPNGEEYKRLIGKLIYLAVTRPDINYSVQNLSQFMQNPTTVHLQAVKRLIRYLKNSPSQGILLASDSAASLTAYCDADWASCPISRKSTTGYCILLGSSPISWKSKKQNVVARSSAEVQYRSMALTTCHLVSFSTQGLGHQGPWLHSLEM